MPKYIFNAGCCREGPHCVLVSFDTVAGSRQVFLHQPARREKIAVRNSVEICPFLARKPNSWTYNFVEVTGHNLESSQIIGKVVWLSIFPPFFLTVCNNLTVETVRGCVSLKKFKSQGKAVEVTMNRKTPKTFVWHSSRNLASGESQNIKTQS
jgi:hypothetical protein